jgi:hypothetical protein
MSAIGLDRHNISATQYEEEILNDALPIEKNF